MIHSTDQGYLSVGSEADITILSVRKGQFCFFDLEGENIQGTRKLECELNLNYNAFLDNYDVICEKLANKFSVCTDLFD
ncbi:MAG: hypothetical protein OEW75_09750 [Cyclobacteriaceae bacterium]|nr:hypothetical protein [Cyclobacteriaceae bacterium]